MTCPLRHKQKICVELKNWNFKILISEWIHECDAEMYPCILHVSIFFLQFVIFIGIMPLIFAGLRHGTGITLAPPSSPFMVSSPPPTLIHCNWYKCLLSLGVTRSVSHSVSQSHAVTPHNSYIPRPPTPLTISTFICFVKIVLDNEEGSNLD